MSDWLKLLPLLLRERRLSRGLGNRVLWAHFVYEQACRAAEVNG